MSTTDPIVAQFESYRPHLLAVATRLLGSAAEAADAVQETWLRFERAECHTIHNPGGWLTTVVSRICLDHLRARSARAEEPITLDDIDLIDTGPTPEQVVIADETTAAALAVVLETLAPIERVTFVLHDVFDVRFDDIATIVERSPDATRQVASRARRRIRAAIDSGQQLLAAPGEIVAAFFAAAREGQFESLIRLLAPDVVLRADATTVLMGGVGAEIRGAVGVAETFSGRAHAARLATIDGQPGATWAPGGKPRVVFKFTISEGSIEAIEMIADAETLSTLDVQIQPKPGRSSQTSTEQAVPTSED